LEVTVTSGEAINPLDHLVDCGGALAGSQIPVVVAEACRVWQSEVVLLAVVVDLELQVPLATTMGPRHLPAFSESTYPLELDRYTNRLTYGRVVAVSYHSKHQYPRCMERRCQCPRKVLLVALMEAVE